MRHFLTIVCLFLALAFYSLGAAGPGTGLLLLGALSEGAFWYRVSGGRRKP